MAKTNAERQRAYRQRAYKDVDGLLLTRFQVSLGPTPARVLVDLCDEWKCSKREVIERLLKAADPLLQRNEQ
jgi:hypothetical protein